MEETKDESSAGETSSSLNVWCVICTEIFKSTDNIVSTSKCGHVFHCQCLLRWLKTSNTCPQCRTSVRERNIRRLFLNFTEVYPELNNQQLDSQISVNFSWVDLDENDTAEDISKYGFIAGLDKESQPVFVARVQYQDNILPCYYVPKLKGVFAAYNCTSHFLTRDIELLDISDDNADYKWVSASNGEVPENALPTGDDISLEILYTARALYNGRLRYGKLHPSHGCAYLPYKNLEVNNKNYEVLVRIPKDEE